MPNWNEILGELQRVPSPFDTIRRKYLTQLFDLRNRNVIAYYSGFMTKPNAQTMVQDSDKELFMTAIHKLDKNLGLDLILNTEGGDIAATESIIDYLYKMFGKNIEVFVPQISMSAGTLMACMGKIIHMGLQSNLGPIDPQFNGISAKMVISEFEQAKKELSDPQNPNYLYWQIQLQKYPPTFLELCQKAVTWSEELARKLLLENMLAETENKEQIAENIISQLTNPDTTYSHGRHIHIEQLENIGLKINRLENNQDLQDIVLSIHHSFMHTIQNTPAFKIVENHNGIATIFNLTK